MTRLEYAHVCPRCGSAAYVGLTSVDCTYKYCRHHRSLRRLGVMAAEQVEALWREFSRVSDTTDADVLLAKISRLVETHYATGG